jgi:hypothetical protein
VASSASRLTLSRCHAPAAEPARAPGRDGEPAFGEGVASLAEPGSQASGFGSNSPISGQSGAYQPLPILRKCSKSQEVGIPAVTAVHRLSQPVCYTLVTGRTAESWRSAAASKRSGSCEGPVGEHRDDLRALSTWRNAPPPGLERDPDPGARARAGARGEVAPPHAREALVTIGELRELGSGGAGNRTRWRQRHKYAMVHAFSVRTAVYQRFDVSAEGIRDCNSPLEASPGMETSWRPVGMPPPGYEGSCSSLGGGKGS